MAKRKRLTPLDPDRVAQTRTGSAALSPLGDARASAPIADVARDSSASAALEEMTRNWVDAREDGRLVVVLPHDEIRLDHLQRDRVAIDPDDMASLKQSLFERGQQTPIEAVALPGGGYGLLSGWRRCQALRTLYEDTGEARFAAVQALLRRPEDASGAYRTMVEENEIRANLSHYERARIVVKAVEAGVFATEKDGLAALFGSTPRARRSKIRSFLPLVHALDEVIAFPGRISERVGLELAQRLREDAALGPRLKQALRQVQAEDAATEQAVIAAALAPQQTESTDGKEALNSASVSQPGPDSDVLAAFDGLRLRHARGGSLVLSGPAVTEDLTRELIDWLASRQEN